MLAEAAAIAEMERQALQMSAKRAELQADMSNKLQLEDTMVQEAQTIARKREAIEAKMRQEEAELQKLSDDAKHRVLEKMAAEAAAIADMEKEASRLAEERAVLASQIAEQRSSKSVEDAHQETSTTPITISDKAISQPHHAGTVDTQVVSMGTLPDHYGSGATPTPIGGADGEGGTDEVTQGTPNIARMGLREGQEDPWFASHVAIASSTPCAEELRDGMADDAGSSIPDGLAINDSHWNQQPTLPTEGLFDSNVCTYCRAHQRDLSSGHLAAAAGHVTCLEAIQCAQRDLLAEVDSSGRSPLFYACANAHADAADLLIQESPQSSHATDANGDTPLHAAALAGSRLCCRLLLQQGLSEVEPLNQMQMTPAHLAANNDVLEVLSQHGANLNAKVGLAELLVQGLIALGTRSLSIHTCFARKVDIE